jgi:hypothetical protein
MHPYRWKEPKVSQRKKTSTLYAVVSVTMRDEKWSIIEYALQKSCSSKEEESGHQSAIAPGTQMTLYEARSCICAWRRFDDGDSEDAQWV